MRHFHFARSAFPLISILTRQRLAERRQQAVVVGGRADGDSRKASVEAAVTGDVADEHLLFEQALAELQGVQARPRGLQQQEVRLRAEDADARHAREFVAHALALGDNRLPQRGRLLRAGQQGLARAERQARRPRSARARTGPARSASGPRTGTPAAVRPARRSPSASGARSRSPAAARPAATRRAIPARTPRTIRPPRRRRRRISSPARGSRPPAPRRRSDRSGCRGRPCPCR